MMFVLLIPLAFLLIYIFMRQPQFGKSPAGERLARILASPNYRNGQFQNLNNTPALAEGATYFGVMRKFFFGKDKRVVPSSLLPSRKTNLKELPAEGDWLVWFGHSSYFLQIAGKKMLVDPVFSGNASPVRFTTKSFKGSDIYTSLQIPEIDYLFITHDHYDHLDHKTIVSLKHSVKKVITGLGVGAHLERWGYDRSKITECDWNERLQLDDGLVVDTVSARHFSGRGFRRNGSLWMSYVISIADIKVFIGGDSGYDDHFKKVGEQHGPFDLVILENGQYNEDWKYIHMMPEEVVQAAIDLKAKRLFPVHWSKFSLSIHAWDEPVNRVVKEAAIKHMPLLHPMIGEAVNLKQFTLSEEWWRQIS